MTHRSISLARAAMTPLLALAAAAVCATTPTTYECTYLTGTGQGDSQYPEGHAINDLGTVAGVARYRPGELDEVAKATLWVVGEEPVQLPTLNLPFHEVADVNNAGQVVGAEILRSYLDPTPITWRNGQAEVLPILPGSWAGNGRALAINDKGDIVGASGAFDPPYTRNMHATLWRRGKVIDLGALGGHNGQVQRVSAAVGINDAGVIVGWSDLKKSRFGGQHAVRWDNPWTIVDLGTLPNVEHSEANAINKHGTIVGFSDREREINGIKDRRAVAWDANGIHELGIMKGFESSTALKVSDDGVIVGKSVLPDFETSRAMVWFGLDGAARNLNHLVGSAGCQDPTGASFVLEVAQDINQSGVILATGASSDGARHATFELVPR